MSNWGYDHDFLGGDGEDENGGLVGRKANDNKGESTDDGGKRENFHVGGGKPFFWVVHGCAGSGKTLILLQLAKEFVMSRSLGEAFIYVNQINEELLKFSRISEGFLIVLSPTSAP